MKDLELLAFKWDILLKETIAYIGLWICCLFEIEMIWKLLHGRVEKMIGTIVPLFLVK